MPGSFIQHINITFLHKSPVLCYFATLQNKQKYTNKCQLQRAQISLISHIILLLFATHDTRAASAPLVTATNKPVAVCHQAEATQSRMNMLNNTR